MLYPKKNPHILNRKYGLLIVVIERSRTETKWGSGSFCFEELLLPTEAHWVWHCFAAASALQLERTRVLHCPSDIFHEPFECYPEMKEVLSLALREAELCSSLGRHGDKPFCWFIIVLARNYNANIFKAISAYK